MDPVRFKALLVEHLLPMLPGAVLRGPEILSGKYKQKAVAFVGPRAISVRPERSATYEFRLVRSQKYLPKEIRLVECFVEATRDVEGALGSPFESEVLRGLPLRVVARATGGTAHKTMLRVLEQFNSWAAEKYEGSPIAAAVGLDPSAVGVVPIDEGWKEHFAPVISNGMDTFVVVDGEGRAGRLEAAEAVPPPSLSPNRFGGLAAWASGERVAVALTRAGEILIFRGRSLRFALRARVWHHYTHEAVLSAVHLPYRRPVKSALYETLLDVSFARTGGCVAVVDRAHLGRLQRYVASRDLLRPPRPALPSTKARLIVAAVGTEFRALDRRIRAELLAVDGATILSSAGKILAVGAIVRIGPGSAAGGRLAAARTLARLGLGVMISQDGGVTGYDPKGRVLFAFG